MFSHKDKLREHRSFLIKGTPTILDDYLLFTPDLNLDFFNRIRKGDVVWFNPKTTRDLAICISDSSKNKIVVFRSEYRFERGQETTEVWIVGSSCEYGTV